MELVRSMARQSAAAGEFRAADQERASQRKREANDDVFAGVQFSRDRARSEKDFLVPSRRRHSSFVEDKNEFIDRLKYHFWSEREGPEGSPGTSPIDDPDIGSGARNRRSSALGLQAAPPRSSAQGSGASRRRSSVSSLRRLSLRGPPAAPLTATAEAPASQAAPAVPAPPQLGNSPFPAHDASERTSRSRSVDELDPRLQLPRAYELERHKKRHELEAIVELLLLDHQLTDCLAGRQELCAHTATCMKPRPPTTQTQMIGSPNSLTMRLSHAAGPSSCRQRSASAPRKARRGLVSSLMPLAGGSTGACTGRRGLSHCARRG